MKSDTSGDFSRAVRRARRFRAVLLAATLLLAAGCASDRPPRPHSENGDDAATPADKQIEVEGVSMMMTSGTLVLREVAGERAVFREEARTLEATSLTLRLNLPEQNQVVTATATRGKVFLAGKRPGKRARDEKKLEETPSLAELKALADPARDYAFGDVLLEGAVDGRTEGGGRFRAGTVFWSDVLGCLVVPGPFEQFARFPDGSELSLKGEGFYVDSTLRHWTYFSDKEPLRGEMRAGGE